MSGSNASGGVPENERANEAISVNGLRVTDNNFLLDGLDNNEFGLGGVVVLPPPDAIQEFSTEENGMSAEFGRGGAAINVALKSGTNQIHGDVYEFVRNDVFDARNFFEINRAPFRRNQYGFSLGGPIKKDRTFFFIDYQGTQIREGIPFLSTVPTSSMRNGDFTQLGTPIYDPLTTNPATGARSLINPSNPMVIPANRINRAGQNVTNLYPLPNLPGIFNNYLLNPTLNNNQNSFDTRLDQRISDRDQLFVDQSFGIVRDTQPAPLGSGGGGTASFAGNIVDGDQHWGIGWTHSISSNLVNDLHGGFMRYSVNAVPPDYGTEPAQALGIPNANRGNLASSGLPQFSVSGFQGLGDTLWFPEKVAENIFQAADTLSMVHDRHSLKFGMDFGRQQRNFFQDQEPRGWFTFSGQYSSDLATGAGGNGLADLLLGLPISSYQDAFVGEDPTRYWDLAEFVQDDFRATPSLTLNLGLRYEVDSPVNGQVANFNSATGKMIVSTGPGGVPHAGISYDLHEWAPRLGLAWSPGASKTTVIRSAFGIFYSPEGNIFDDLGVNPPFYTANTVNFNPFDLPTATQPLSAGFPSVFQFASANSPHGSIYMSPQNRPVPYIMEWNFNIQHQFEENWLLEVGYVGTRAVNLWNHASSDLNQAPVPLDTNFQNGTNFGRRIYNLNPNIASLLPLDYAQFDMSYNALEVSLNKKFSHGMNMLLSYTYSNSLGTADGNVGSAIQDAYNVNAEYGPVNPDFLHQFVASYLYELPVGRGKRFLSNLAGAGNAILGGWEISGITTARTGEAFTPTLSFDPTNTGSFSPRPNVIASPNNFSFNPNAQAALGCPPGQQTLACWFNQAAYVLPPLAPGQSSAHVFGNASRGSLRGPDFVDFDFALLKDFQVTERNQLQFRAEIFNLLNRPNFALPGNLVDVPGGASISSTVLDNQREIQFALKWNF